MNSKDIRNIAIIAHVDHGKTTLVDQLFRQSGLFRDNQVVDDRLMDSMDLERERGITISSKNGSFSYKGKWINIIDTPGHADFGGQVERVLKMADGTLLLVDAQEGPMPQTHFVLRKAVDLNLPTIVVINKIDKADRRPDWVVDQVFDLFVKLEAPDSILDFPVIYTSARDGYAAREPDGEQASMEILMDEILRYVPPPAGDPEGPLQLQVSSIDYSPYLGRLGIGKITSGMLNINKSIVVADSSGEMNPARISKIYRFRGKEKVSTEAAVMGEIVAVAGRDKISVSDTFTDPENPIPCEPLKVSPPTISMDFLPNNSPFAGRDGKFVTSRHLMERLDRETLGDVALVVEDRGKDTGYKVSGRGELHISILIEKMRREGYEFQVSRPRVIFREKNGKTLEPYEELTVDIPEEFMGSVVQKLGTRKGKMLEMNSHEGMVRLLYKIPTRGLFGYRSEFLSDTKGMGVMNYMFMEYDRHAGEFKNRTQGVLVSQQNCTSTAYALFNLQNRGQLFVGPGTDVYAGQIVGEHSRANDLTVNPAKAKALTNSRAAGSDENIILTPPIRMSLEECITFINDDELVEVTPKAIRLRKSPA